MYWCWNHHQQSAFSCLLMNSQMYEGFQNLCFTSGCTWTSHFSCRKKSNLDAIHRNSAPSYPNKLWSVKTAESCCKKIHISKTNRWFCRLKSKVILLWHLDSFPHLKLLFFFIPLLKPLSVVFFFLLLSICIEVFIYLHSTWWNSLRELGGLQGRLNANRNELANI